MSLSDAQIRSAKGRGTPYKLWDGGGLYLLVKPDGSRYWRHDYRFHGKRRTLGHGVYPAVTLSEARASRDQVRKLVREQVDPSADRRRKRLSQRLAQANTFEALAREYLVKSEREGRDPATTQTNQRRLELYVYPLLGARPIVEITPLEILDSLNRIQVKGALETAKRVKQLCGQVFRFAIVTGRASTDPTYALRGALIAPPVKHFAAIVDPEGIGGLLRAIDGYSGQITTLMGLKLAMLTVVRPGNLRHMEWQELDLDRREWRIPAVKMKMKEGRLDHRVPLSSQAVAVLKTLHPITGRGRYVFPSTRSAARPMSENTINAALRRLGYTKEEVCGHGFRTTASTLLNESGLWNADAIERQLAHQEKNEVRRAYMHPAEFWNERVRMMQWWANYLDKLRDRMPMSRTSMVPRRREVRKRHSA